MNDGGSVLGGNQTASGGTDASNSADLKISHDDAPAAAPETPATSEAAPALDTSSTPTSEATATPASSPFSNENVLTSADNLEISNENLTEEINAAVDSLSAPSDNTVTTTDSSTETAEATPTNSEAIEEEHVPILPPSSGPAHIFGQEISGITDEDLSSPASQPIATTVFPNMDNSTPVEPAPEATPPAPTTVDSGAITTSAAVPSQPTESAQTTPQSGYVAPSQPVAEPIQPAAPAVPYEQQFMEQLHTDPNAPKPRNTGDILINPEIGAKKTRNRLIIGVVIAVLVVAVLGVVAYFSISGNPIASTQKQRVAPQAATMEALDAYGASLSDWKPDTKSSNEKISTAYNAFYELAMADPAFESMHGDLDSYLNYIDFAKYVGPLEKYDYGSLLEKYMEVGYDETQDEIEEIYDSTGAPNVTKGYLDTMFEYLQTCLDAFDVYNYADCFTDEGVDMVCASAAEDANYDLVQLRMQTFNSMNEATTNEQGIYALIQSSYDTIKSKLNTSENNNANS